MDYERLSFLDYAKIVTINWVTWNCLTLEHTRFEQLYVEYLNKGKSFSVSGEFESNIVLIFDARKAYFEAAQIAEIYIIKWDRASICYQESGHSFEKCCLNMLTDATDNEYVYEQKYFDIEKSWEFYNRGDQLRQRNNVYHICEFTIQYMVDFVREITDCLQDNPESPRREVECMLFMFDKSFVKKLHALFRPVF
ncbi:hypothetical protein RF11_13017 [Thelohanellus kitauei]|uniref:Uncharacterized protein n=1 Tax=Thelohanellus kitauei TaxID=669202 RepID=A0A0C2IG59_THEKT|nr:hypothetical protein RF11_13017 [Thelohanellus kitauei]